MAILCVFSVGQGDVAPAEISVSGDVVVTARRLRRHEVIAAQDVTLRRMDVTGLSAWVITDPDSVVGRWTEQAIAAGEIVDRRWVVDLPLVRRGETVTLTNELGAVRAATVAVAMEDGYRDQQILVRLRSDRRLMAVRVTDSAAVVPWGVGGSRRASD